MVTGIMGILGLVAAGLLFLFLRKMSLWRQCPPIAVSVTDALVYLKPGRDQAKERENLWKNKILLAGYALFGGSVLLMVSCVVQVMSGEAASVSQLERPEPGQGKKQVNLSAWIGQENIPVTVEVSERVPTEEEANLLLEKSYQILKERMLGRNPSAEQVSQPLNLVTTLEETACQVYWYIDNTDRIDRNGIVYTDGIGEREMVRLTAEISISSYRKEYEFTVFVVPVEMDAEEKLVYRVKQEIKAAETEDVMSGKIVLPQTVEEKKIVFREPETNQGAVLCVLVFVTAVGVMFLPEQKLMNQKKEKENQLNLAYAEIVSKLCLLIGSGLTVRMAWERIVQDYRESKMFDYAYEEMLFTYYELERGIPEGKAYMAFGRRCRLHGYRKLGSLLEQNLKKGTAGLLALLQEETWQAFEDRRAYAVKQAQEAGIRLLLPMILLLLVVLIICVVPAVMSF